MTDFNHLDDSAAHAQRIQHAEEMAQLDAEVRRIREQNAGDTAKTEGLEHGRPDMSRVLGIAEVMPEAIASLGRAQAKWAAFRDTVRPDFDALPEAKACKHHPSVMRAKLFEETCQKTWNAREFRVAWAPCGECQGAESKTRQRAFWSKRGVPARVVEESLSTYTVDTTERVDAHAKVRGWIKRNGVFLLLAGTPGTGKGHLAVGCLKAQGNGIFITHADMLSDLRASYTLSTTPALIKAWQEAEMLVLDEFGLSVGGKDEEPMLYQVLSSRYENRRPTIITSNLDLGQLRDAIGFRLLDRMQEDCETVICNWPSWRTGK